jgi:hypothetical protein
MDNDQATPTGAPQVPANPSATWPFSRDAITGIIPAGVARLGAAPGEQSRTRQKMAHVRAG